MTYLVVGQASEGYAFGQVAANGSIAILVGAPLVGGVGSGEIDGCRERSGHCFVASEFASVVEGDGLYPENGHLFERVDTLGKQRITVELNGVTLETFEEQDQSKEVEIQFNPDIL